MKSISFAGHSLSFGANKPQQAANSAPKATAPACYSQQQPASLQFGCNRYPATSFASATGKGSRLDIQA